DVLKRRLDEASLTRVARLEMRTLPALVWLERAGVRVDADGWRALADEAVADLRATERRLTALTGTADLFGKSGVNRSSPAQVVKVLRARGHDVARSDEATLFQLAQTDPLAEALLKHRELSKRVSAYGHAFLNRRDPETGRIHPNYLQLGSVAG